MLSSKEVNEATWVDGCTDAAVVLPTWKKAETKLCRALSRELEKDLKEPVQRQILFEILGVNFVNKYFTNFTYDSSLLENINSKKKDKKMAEMHIHLANVMEAVVKSKGSKGRKNKGTSEFSSFCVEAREVVEKDFNKHLSQSRSKKSKKSNSLSKQWNQILSYDQSLIEHLIMELRVKSVVLSDHLRMLIWPHVLSSKENAKGGKHQKSDQSKKKFSQSYSQRSGSVFQSEIVSSVYKENKSVATLYTEDNVDCTVDILARLNGYNKNSFENSVIFWVIIMQKVFLGSKNYEDEEIATTAMMTEKVLRFCYPVSEKLSHIASDVIDILDKMDKELLDHIKQKIQISKPTSGKDISSEQAHTSAKKSYVQYSSYPKDISNPKSYIEKWLSEGFVSVLSVDALLLIWDQLFLNSWDNQAIQAACFTLLGLLKPWFMSANNCDQICNVFCHEPLKLYLLDIKTAWQHVLNKGSFDKLPSMNRNIKYGEKVQVEKKPVPPPSPPAPSASPPPPPPPLPPPRPSLIPWLPYSKDKAKELTSVRPKVDSVFDLYIDSVRFVPDNATVVKVTGKIINMYIGKKDKNIKMVGYPVLDSQTRYPAFRVKQTVNQEQLPMNPDVVIMLRIYTVERYSKKAVVLGSCLFCPFSNKYGKQATLRTGGHQIRLRYGVPDPDFTVEHLLASHMDDNIVIPGVTILIRVLPYQKEYAPAPEYENGLYRSEIAKPNKSEIKLYEHYQQMKDFEMSVRDTALLLSGITSANDETLEQSIKQLLDNTSTSVEDFPYQRYVNYDKKMGLSVLIDKAYGLPIFLEGRYLQCLAQVFPGEDTKIGNGKSQVISFMTEELDLDSSQRAPDWSDTPVKVSPDYDNRSFILICLYGLRPLYNPALKKITDRKGKEPVFYLEHAVAWSAVPCFENDAVLAGTHHVPLLKGIPSEEIIEKLSYLPLDYICKKFKTQLKIFDTASIEVTVWDGHFISTECPPLPIHANCLNISPNPRKFLLAKEQKVGAPVLQVLKSGMKDPSDFGSHKKQIVALLKEIFRHNFNEALQKAGYSKLI